MSGIDNKKAKRRKSKKATVSKAAVQNGPRKTIADPDAITSSVTDISTEVGAIRAFQSLEKLMDAPDDETALKMLSFPRGANPFLRERCLLCNCERHDPPEAEAIRAESQDQKHNTLNNPLAQWPLWVCPSCRKAADQEIDKKPSIDHFLEPEGDSFLPDISIKSGSEPTTPNGSICTCDACTERRIIESEHDLETKELQRHWTDLRKVVRCLYGSHDKKRADGKPDVSRVDLCSEDDHVVDVDKIKNLVHKLCSRDPHQLFLRLELQVREFMLEVQIKLVKQLQPGFETPPQAKKFIQLLLDSYAHLCSVAEKMSSLLNELENHLKNFKVTWDLHNKHLFQSIVYAEPSIKSSFSLLTNQLRLGAASKESYTEDTYPNLLHQFLKFDDEMNVICSVWRDCHELIESYNDEQSALKLKQKMLREDWEFFKTQRKILEQQVSKNPKASLSHNLEAQFTETMRLMLQGNKPTQDELTCPRCNRKRCPCDECTITHMITCGIINQEVLDSANAPNPLTPHSLMPHSLSMQHHSLSHHPHLHSATGFPASLHGLGHGGPFHPHNPAGMGFNTAGFLHDGSQYRLDVSPPSMSSTTSSSSGGSGASSPIMVDPDRLTLPFPETENTNEDEIQAEIEENLSFDDDDDDEDDDDDDDGDGDDEAEEDCVDKLEPVEIPELPPLACPKYKYPLMPPLMLDEEESLRRADLGKLDPCNCDHCVSQAKLEQLKPEENQCQCHVCLQQQGKAVSTSLPQNIPSIVPRPGELHLYPHIHGSTGLHTLGRGHVRPILQPSLYDLHLPNTQRHKSIIQQSKMPMKLEFDGGDGLNDHIYHAYQDWDNTAYDPRLFLGGGKFDSELIPPPPFTSPYTSSLLSEPLSLSGMLSSVSAPTVTSAAPSSSAFVSTFANHSAPSPLNTQTSSQQPATSKLTDYLSGLSSLSGLSGLASSVASSMTTSKEVPGVPVSVPVSGVKHGSQCSNQPGGLTHSQTSQNATPPCSRPATLGGNNTPKVQEKIHSQHCRKHNSQGSAKSGVSGHNHVTGQAGKLSAAVSRLEQKAANLKSLATHSHTCAHLTNQAMAGKVHDGTNSSCANGMHLPTSVHGGNNGGGHNHGNNGNVSVGVGTSSAVKCSEPDCDGNPDNDDSYDDNCSEKSSSTSNSTNQKEGKYCDCCYCEFFGHGNPPMAPTSKNYAEMRDKLRLRLKKKAETRSDELLTRCVTSRSQAQSPAAVQPVVGSSQSPVSVPAPAPFTAFPVSEADPLETKGLDELIKFINGTEEEDDRRPSAKAAKRARQKQRKAEEKARKDAEEQERARRQLIAERRRLEAEERQRTLAAEEAARKAKRKDNATAGGGKKGSKKETAAVAPVKSGGASNRQAGSADGSGSKSMSKSPSPPASARLTSTAPVTGACPTLASIGRTQSAQCSKQENRLQGRNGSGSSDVIVNPGGDNNSDKNKSQKKKGKHKEDLPTVQVNITYEMDEHVISPLKVSVTNQKTAPVSNHGKSSLSANQKPAPSGSHGFEFSSSNQKVAPVSNHGNNTPPANHSALKTAATRPAPQGGRVASTPPSVDNRLQTASNSSASSKQNKNKEPQKTSQPQPHFGNGDGVLAPVPRLGTINTEHIAITLQQQEVLKKQTQQLIQLKLEQKARKQRLLAQHQADQPVEQDKGKPAAKTAQNGAPPQINPAVSAAVNSMNKPSSASPKAQMKNNVKITVKTSTTNTNVIPSSPRQVEGKNVNPPQQTLKQVNNNPVTQQNEVNKQQTVQQSQARQLSASRKGKKPADNLQQQSPVLSAQQSPRTQAKQQQITSQPSQISPAPQNQPQTTKVVPQSPVAQRSGGKLNGVPPLTPGSPAKGQVRQPPQGQASVNGDVRTPTPDEGRRRELGRGGKQPTQEESPPSDQGRNSGGKNKKMKRKNKTSGDIGFIDEVFMPKPESELEAGEMDEFEKELEQFKRFCVDSTPAKREKLQVNLNVKDIFAKKKQPGLACN